MDENIVLVNFIVDENSRIITVPQNGNVFGVTGDMNVNRVIFSLPRYYSGFDMSEFSARVNYVNANGDANYYEADDVTGNEENVTFSWLMGSDVTAYVGDVLFSIKLYKKQNSKITNAFNTAISKGSVLTGLDVEAYVSPEHQQTILEKIDSYADEKMAEIESTIETAKTNALTEINTSVQQIQKNTEDISQLKEELAKLKEAITN